MWGTVRYCRLLNRDSFLPVDMVSLFVIRVRQPGFSLNGINKYLTCLLAVTGELWDEGSLAVTGEAVG